MRLGPVVIRWKADVEKEQHKQDYQCRVDKSLICLQVAQIVKLKAIVHRWGIGGASGKAKTPKGAGALL